MPSIHRAQSWRLPAARRGASTWQRPVSGSTSRKICATPLRTYSCSTRSGWPGSDGQRLPHFADQLLVGLIHADHRPTGMVGTGIDFQNVLHAGYECGAAPGRGPPILLPMRLQLVFFSVRCTVITDTRSTQPSSTTFSASRRRVQRFRPGGAWEAGQGDQASLEHAVKDDFPRRPHPPLVAPRRTPDPAPQTAVSSARPCGPRDAQRLGDPGHGPSRPLRPAVAQQ